MMSTAPNPSFLAPGKRRKIGIACSTCRARKTACDGQRPYCGFCVSRAQEDTCVYEHVESASKKKRKSTSEVNTAPVAPVERERIVQSSPQHDLPQAWRPPAPVIHDDRSGTTSANKSMPREPVSATGGSALRNAREAMRAASQSKRLSESRLSNDESSSQDEVDGFATVKLQDDPEDVLCGPYFGASSSAAFAQRLAANGPPAAAALPPQAAVDVSQAASGSSQQHHHHHPRPRPIRLPQKIRESDDRAAVFPRRNLADEYVRCYFDYYHPLFPVLHQPSFMSKYTQFWASENSSGSGVRRTDLEEAILLSTINLVLALGCRYSTSVQYGDRTAVAAEFFERSQRVFNYDPLDITSLSVVQLLLLQVVYLQSTTSAARCWNVMGLAVRMAQSLGLNMEPADVRGDARRVRRRVWQCCTSMDWLMAATFGRPSMIAFASRSQHTVMVEGEHSEPIGDERPPTAFQYTYTLYGLLEEISTTIYIIPTKHTADKTNDTTKMLNDILELNSRLDTYLDSLPNHMKATLRNNRLTPAPVHHPSYTHEETLSYRFLYTRTLLLRPLLVLPLERNDRNSDYGGPRLDHAFARQGASLCVDTASRIINGLYITIGSRYALAGWHVTYMVFTAATTLLAASKSHCIDSIPDLQSLLDKTTYILNQYTPYEPVAKRAQRALQHLEKQILHRPQHPQDPEHSRHPSHQQSNLPQQSPAITAPSPLLPPLPHGDGGLAGLWTPESLESAGDIGGDPTLWTQDLGELWDDSAWNPSSWLGQQLFMPGLLPLPEV